jgi:hypothetical protein
VRSTRAASIAVALAALAALADCAGDDPQPQVPVDGGADAVVDVAVVADAGSDVEDAAACAEGGRQTELRCTGLYTDFAAKTVAPDVLPYAPAFPLWSDGAIKSRWVRLPPGTQIDATDMDEWRFPVGTTFFKEFALGTRRIETRVIQKQPDQTWLRQTFRWSDDETRATELITGEKNVAGTTYEIPVQAACAVCHTGRIDGVLGFEAVGLGNAGATGLTVSELVARGLLSRAPPTLTVPGNATERAALGWMHANCGTACHNASPFSRANFTYMYLRLEVAKLADVASTDTYRTTIKVPSSYQPFDGEVLSRITPGDPSRSTVALRSQTRVPTVQMPPILTHEVDTAGQAALNAWILALPP